MGSLTSPADHVTLKMQETGPTVGKLELKSHTPTRTRTSLQAPRGVDPLNLNSLIYLLILMKLEQTKATRMSRISLQEERSCMTRLIMVIEPSGVQFGLKSYT